MHDWVSPLRYLNASISISSQTLIFSFFPLICLAFPSSVFWHSSAWNQQSLGITGESKFYKDQLSPFIVTLKQVLTFKSFKTVNVTTYILLQINSSAPTLSSFLQVSPNAPVPSTPAVEEEPDSAVRQWLKEELASLACHHKWAKPSGRPERPSKAHFQLYRQMTHFLIGPPIIVVGIGCMQLNLSYIFVGRMVKELTEPRGWYERIKTK